MSNLLKEHLNKFSTKIFDKFNLITDCDKAEIIEMFTCSFNKLLITQEVYFKKFKIH